MPIEDNKRFTFQGQISKNGQRFAFIKTATDNVLELVFSGETADITFTVGSLEPRRCVAQLGETTELFSISLEADGVLEILAQLDTGTIASPFFKIDGYVNAL